MGTRSTPMLHSWYLNVFTALLLTGTGFLPMHLTDKYMHVALDLMWKTPVSALDLHRFFVNSALDLKKIRLDIVCKQIEKTVPEE